MDTNTFNGLFGKIANGMCRITMNGNIAIKTTNGYKTYNVKNGTLTNVNNFCFDLGCEFFFVMPTMKVRAGDIILVEGKPKCVIEATKTVITAIDYETSEIRQIVPERHMLMGNTFFYGKIVSLLGNSFNGKKGFGKVMKMMVISQMMGKGNGNPTTTTPTFDGAALMNGNFGQMMAMSMLMNNGNGGIFDDLFDNMDMEADDDDNDDNNDNTNLIIEED